MEIYFDIHGNPHEKPEGAEVVWRPSVYGLVVNETDEILAVRSHATGLWELPGGGVEIEETLEEALVREMFEETGYRVEPNVTNPRLIEGNFFRLSVKEYCHAIRMYFSCVLLSENPEQSHIDPTEVTAVSWLPLSRLDRTEWKDIAWQAVEPLIASRKKSST